MRCRLLALLVGALVVQGCAARLMTPQGPETVVFLQRGIILQVTHTCTDFARLYQAGKGLVGNVKGVEPHEIPLEPSIWGDREITLTLQSINSSGRVVGIYVETFRISNHSTTARAWLLSSSGRWFSGGGSHHTRCAE